MKLSGIQLVWIIVTTEVVGMIGLRITPAIQIAKQDAWLSILLAGVIGIGLTFLVVHLSVLHPNQTVIQFSQALLGKWVGRIIGIPYLIAWSILPAFLLRSFVDFIHLILLDKTPLWVIMILLVGVIIYLTYSSGITGIGRICEVVGPIIILMLLISFILNIGNVNWHQLLPVYFDSGWDKILKGAIGPSVWFPGPFILLVIVSFMQNQKKAISKSLIGVCITIFMVITATLMVLMVLGPNFSARIRFSYFVYVETINILNFIQNVDIFVMFVFVFAVFSQLSLYLFVVSYEVANWFNMKNWRKNVWFMAPAIFIMSILIPDESYIPLFDKYWTLIVFPVCGIGIPLLLWLISIVKKKSVQV